MAAAEYKFIDSHADAKKALDEPPQTTRERLLPRLYPWLS
jgi:hypothetical protein